MNKFILVVALLCIIISFSACKSVEKEILVTEEGGDGSEISATPSTESAESEEGAPAGSSSTDSTTEGTLYQKEIGSYYVLDGWEESSEHSGNGKYFYCKEGTADQNTPDNISINIGTNRYSESESDEFAKAIMQQIAQQTAQDEDAQVNAEGTSTDSGATLLIYTIKYSMNGSETVAKQYYIVGEKRFCMVYSTNFDGSSEVDDVARHMVNTFVWAD